MSKELSSEIKELADKIKPGLKFEDGRIIVDVDTYTNTLPEDITKTQVKALNKHNSQFYSAAALAVGNLAIKHLKKQNDLEQIEAAVPLIDKDVLNLTIERKHVFPNPKNKDNPSVTWGNVKAKLTTQAVRSSIGTMSQVRSELASSALAAFGE